ncbi:hypothetical protein BBP40_008795 [Aspergillus hancockii]|nr:hypothetical protein BBP40_008795 [Aspergillus hancockii]
MSPPTAHHLTVFPYTLTAPTKEGNPTTIYLHADNLTNPEMQALAQKSGHECGFVLTESTSQRSNSNIAMRYWVPNHEMEMCGHATVGAIWLLEQLNLLPETEELRVSTMSGIVEARVIRRAEAEHSGSSQILISQPQGSVENLPDDVIGDVLSSLGLKMDVLAPGYRVQNGRTSRTKTLIPVKNVEALKAVHPDRDLIRDVCERIGSTGLYPYVIVDAQKQVVQARQFPKASGYVEDPATGIAAAALTFGLLENKAVSDGTKAPVCVRQGFAMGRPSEIRVFLRRGDDGKVDGCWISGNVQWLHDQVKI